MTIKNELPETLRKTRREIVIRAMVLGIDCPYCGGELEGFIGDPRGAKNIKCDHCGKTFKIPIYAKVYLG